MPDSLEDYLDPLPRPRGASKLHGVQPELETHWSNLEREFRQAGVKPVIKSGFRSVEQQQALYNNPKTRARTKGNDGIKKVSPHQEGRALDIGFAAGGDRGRRIIADYAKRSGLHVPSDEPWHIAIPKQRPSGIESYLDAPEKAAKPSVENYLDPEPQTASPSTMPAPPRNAERRVQQRPVGSPFANVKTGVGGQVPDTGVGAMRRIEDPKTAQINRIQGDVTAQQSPAERNLKVRPGARLMESQLPGENDEVLRRVAAENEASSLDLEAQKRYQREKPEIDRLAKEYRKGIRATGVARPGQQWFSEAGTKGASGLTEKLAAIARSGLATLPFDVPAEHVADTINVHAQAMHQAAVEEGADRNEASKFVQDIVGGFIATSPELVAMGVGVPAPLAFGAGEGLGAYGGNRPVVPAVEHGVATGAAFGLGGHGGKTVASVLKKAGAVGAATTGIDVAAGHPLGEAVKTGLTNAAMVGVPGLANVRKMRLREGVENAETRNLGNRDAVVDSRFEPDYATVPPERVRDARQAETQRQGVQAEKPAETPNRESSLGAPVDTGLAGSRLVGDANAVRETPVHHSQNQLRRARNTATGTKGQFKPGKVEVPPEPATAPQAEPLPVESATQEHSTLSPALDRIARKLEVPAEQAVSHSLPTDQGLQLNKNVPPKTGENITGTITGEPKRQNFTQFASERGYPSDYDVIDHGDLSPSGQVSSRARIEAQGRQSTRAERNAEAHREFEAAIRRGEIEDAESSSHRRVTKEKLEGADKERATRELQSAIAGIDSQIRTIENLGRMSHLPNGKLKAAYQRTVDGYNAKKAEILAAAPQSASAKSEPKGAQPNAPSIPELPPVREGENAVVKAARDRIQKLVKEEDTSQLSATEPRETPAPLSREANTKSQIKETLEKYEGSGELSEQDVVNWLESNDVLPDAVARYRSAQRESRDVWGERMDVTGDVFEKEILPRLREITRNQPEQGPKPDTPASTAPIDVSSILRARTVKEMDTVGGEMVIKAKTSAEIAQIQKAMQQRARELEQPQTSDAPEGKISSVEDKVPSAPKVRPQREAAMKAEKVNRAGFTKTQAEYVGEKLQEIANEEIQRVSEGNRKNTKEFAEGMGGDVPTTRFPLDLPEPKKIKVPGDGEFTVNSLAAANRLRQKVFGQPLEGFEKSKGAGVSTGTRAERDRSFPERNIESYATDLTERFGSEQKALDALTRTMPAEKGYRADKPQGEYQGESTQAAIIEELARRINTPPKAESPRFVKKARGRLAADKAFKESGGKQMRSGGPDTQNLINHMIVHGYDAYVSGKAKFEDWSAEMKKRFGEDVEPHLRKVWAQVTGKEAGDPLSSTAAKRDKVTEEREARGEEAIPRPERKADETLLADAKAANAKDSAAPIRLADEVLNKPRALSDTETVQLDLHKQEIKNKYAELDKKIVDSKDSAEIQDLAGKSDALEREMAKIEEAWAQSGTEKGRALRAQRIEVNQDFSLLAMVSRAKKARGKDLTTEERSTIKEQHAKIVDLEAKLTEANARAVKAEAERAVIRVKRDVAKENRTAARGARRVSLDSEAAQLKQLIAQEWKKVRGGGEGVHSALGVAKLDPEGVVTKLVVQLAKNRLKANFGLKAEALIDDVHGLLRDAVDLSRRDVAEMISGYGKTYEMSQEKVDVKLRELKSIIASNLGKADVIEKGMAPARRGLQRDKPTQEMRTAARELRDALREHGIKIERSPRSIEEQQKSVMDAAKTNTRNRIEDLKAWITAGTRIVKGKTEIIPDAELTALRGERDRLTKIFDALDDPAADAKTIANKLRAANKSVADLDAQIRSGKVKATVQKPSGPTSPALEAARAEQKILREIVGKMRAAERKAGKTPPEPFEVEAKKLLAANKAFETRTEKQIADLERRLAQGDFSDKPKREPTVYNRENLALQKQLEQIKVEYSRANYKATRGRSGMIWDEVLKAGNLPKTLKSMGDISAVFRQGGFYSLSHPVEGFLKPTAAMIQSFKETGFRNVENAIKNHPKFEQAKRDGVEFTGVDKADPNLSHMEEGFFGGETIDLLATGKYNPVKAVKGLKDFSQRTFVSFLDSQRMNMYDVMTKGLTDPGIIARTLGQKSVTRATSPKDFKELGKLINSGTGRGDLGKTGNQAAPFLNILMFSPRLVASRVQLLNNMSSPIRMARMPAGARRQMIADNVRFLAATAVVMKLAMAAGGTVNWDPDDADFLKIRFGKTTYDTLTGLQQPMRYIINMARAATGDETYPGKDMSDLTLGTKTGGGGFIPSKASPLVGAAWEGIRGVDFSGRPRTKMERAGDLFSPLPAKDFWEAMQKEGLVKGALKASPSLTGIGVQTYDEVPEPKTRAEKLARKFKGENVPKKPRTAEQIDLGRKVNELKTRARKGDDVASEIADLEGTISDRQAKDILKSGDMTGFQADFKGLTKRQALIVYKVADADKRAEVKVLLERKMADISELPDAEQADLTRRMGEIGMVPDAPGTLKKREPQKAREPRKPAAGSKQRYVFPQ